MRLDEWLRQAEQRLRDAGVEEARWDAGQIAQHALGQPRAWIVAHGEEPIPASAEALLIRRIAREPLAYILGSAGFYGREFAVGPGALSPRSETELIIDQALPFLAGRSEPRVLDAGCGSGCLAVTLALEAPQAEVWAVDISPDALRWTRQNAAAHAAQVQILESDWLSALPAGLEFDLIVSNPPYIGLGEPVCQEAAEHEPAVALYADEGGLAAYRRLAEEAPARLAPEGLIMVELGAYSLPGARALFEGHGWRVRGVEPDLAGLPRVLIADHPGAPGP
jgi:release factor glutamine methyltransferase